MNRLITLVLLSIVLLPSKIIAQNCFEINSILVDACGNPEGENEMVRFTVGSTGLSTTNLTVAWPNALNLYLGICQNANTAVTVAQLNATVQACGYILEPTSNTLPANSTVILASSANLNPAFNSFANLADTIYMIFQCAGNTNGHFKNYGSPTPRILIMDFGIGCSDTVAYIPDSLIDQSGLHVPADGASVDFDNAGNPTYTNPGCQAPIIPLGANLTASATTVCTGATVTLTAANLTGNVVSYQWIGGNGTIASPTSLTTSYQTSATFTGIDYIIFALTGICGNIVYDTVAINIQSGTPVSITPGGPTTFCSGGSVTLTASGGGTYLWSTADTTVSITVTTSGVYSVTSSGSCGTTTATQSVTVITAPVVTINTSGPTALCAGDTVTLTAVGGTAYTWSTGATTPSITVNTAGTYTVTSSNICGADSAQVVITVTTVPSVSITASGPVIFCQGDTVILTANGTGSFLWSTGATASSIIVSATGNYVVTLTNSCGTATASQQVTVNPGATISINASGPTTFCNGGSVTLTATGGTSYTWSTGAITPSITVLTSGVYTVTGNTSCGTSTASQTVTVDSPPSAQITSSSLSFCQGSSTTLNVLGNGTYLWSTGSTASNITVSTASTFTVTVTNLCGSSTASATTIVNPLPNAQIMVSGPTTFCQGGSVTLTASGGTSFSWSTGVTTPSINVAQTGSYTVTATNLCGSSTATQSVTVNQIPVAAISSGSLVICPGASITLTGTGTGNYLWSTGETSSQISTSLSGVYTLTISNSCGTDSASTSLTQSLIDVDFTADEITGTAPLTVNFLNQSISATNYTWNFGDDQTSTTTNPQHIFSHGGTFIVLLIGSDFNGCSDTATTTIIVEDVEMPVPNIITPNDDNKNDYFHIISTRIKSADIKIYNRWGTKVADFTDWKEGWNANEASAGTYFYVVQLEYFSGESKTEKGILTVIK